METENQAKINAPVNQEADSRLNKPVGTIEQEKLNAKEVKVLNVEVREQHTKEGKKVSDMLHISCKHPDKEEAIDLTKILYLKTTTKGKSVVETGLWYNEDKESNLQKGSPIASLLSHYGLNSIVELKDKELETEANQAGYLCIKSY